MDLDIKKSMEESKHYKKLPMTKLVITYFGKKSLQFMQ